MNNECTANQRNHGTGITYKCNLHKDHAGDHKSLSKHAEVMQRWVNTATTYAYVSGRDSRYTAKVAGAFHETPEVVLALTLEELKGIVYALSSPEWREDEPELVAKIDKALKEAL